MHATSAKCIEIHRKRGDQGFAFARLHFRNHALVLHHAANQLHIEVAHVEHTASRLAHYCESFYQDFVQHFLQGFVLLFFELLGAVKIADFRLGIGINRRARGQVTQPLLDALPEFVGLSTQLGIRELFYLRLEGINSRDLGHQTLDDPFVLSPKDLANQSVYQAMKSLTEWELPECISLSLAYLDAANRP